MKVLVLVFALNVLNENVDCGIKYSKKGACQFVKYEGGDGTVNISPIPKIEAAVPTTVLANMFGKETKFVKSGLAKNLVEQFANAALGLSKLFSKAPKLGPCLGALGIGFRAVSQKLNEIKPADIIANVNKAIDKVVDATNRRFEVMEELVYQSTRNMLRESMNNDYRGIFEKWAKCIEKPRKYKVNECQERTLESITERKYHFLMQHKFENDPDGQLQLSKNEIKVLELQTPMTKKWADFHLLVLAALINAYKEEKDNKKNDQDTKDDARVSYETYKRYLITDGTYYIRYMQWAVQHIKKARIQNQNKPPKLSCKSWNDVISRWWWFPTDNNLKSTTRKCSFKCTSMKPSYCDLTVKFTCDRHCTLCAGLFCDTTDAMAGEHNSYGVSQVKKANALCEGYRNSLEIDVNAFWSREIEVFLPIMEDVINGLDDESNYEAGSGRDDVPGDKNYEGNNIKISPKDIKLNEKLNRLSEKKKKAEKEALKGVTAQMSLAEYLATVKKNTDEIEKKKARKKRRRKKDMKKIQVSD